MSLLRRLGKPEWTDSQERESVRFSVLNILGTRQASAPTAPGYGLPDPDELALALPATAPVLVRAMRQTIQEFEPRLKQVLVRHLAEEGRSDAFELTAELHRPGRSPEAFVLRVAFDGYGAVKAI